MDRINLLDPILSAILVFILGLTLTLLVFFQKKRNYNLLNFIPHWWTGLGVLGTFISLFYNLYYKQISFDAEHIAETIRGLTGAFSTSIVGVFGSLITSIIIKIKLNKLKIKESQGKPYLQKDPRELLQEIKDTLGVHLNKLEQNSEIGFHELKTATDSIASKIDLNLKEYLDQIKNNLVEALARLGSETMEESNERMKEIFENQEKAINDLLGDQKELGEKLLKGHSSFLQQIQGEQEQFYADSLDDMRKSRKALTDTTQQISEDLDSTSKEIIAELATVGESISGIGNKMQGAIDQILKDRITSLELIFENINNWQANIKLTLESTLESFKDAVSEYQNIQDSNKQTLDQVSDQTEALKELAVQTQRLVESWTNYEDHLDGLDDRVRELNNLITHLAKVEKALKNQHF